MSAIPFSEVRAWMFESALPFWGDAGLDRARGGFFEELNLDGRPTDAPFKRTRVTSRQIYAFSHASLLGWEPGDALAASATRISSRRRGKAPIVAGPAG